MRQGSSTGSSTTGVYRWNRLDTANIKLPSAYDYRKTGRAPQIGNQGSLGTCWAFASLTALESSLLPGKSCSMLLRKTICKLKPPERQRQFVFRFWKES